MNTKYVIRNGELIEKEKANISIYSKSLFFDFCVYSNIKVVHGSMFVPHLEIKKLFQSAEIIGLDHPFTEEEVVSWTRTLIKVNHLSDALIRLLLIGPEKESEATLFLFPVGLTFHPKKLYTKGAKVITYEGERVFPTAKSKDLLLGYLGYQEAMKNDAIDALLVDNEGNIREGTRS
ncbi:MAG: aminotransferase class IV, partial [Candidatus Altiarchaeota archaeon]